MKKYPKIVQADSRGQIVIPKDMRQDLNIDEGTGFWMYAITNEGILLKKIDTPALEEQSMIIHELDAKSDKIKLKKSNLQDSMKKYRKTKQGGLDLI